MLKRRKTLRRGEPSKREKEAIRRIVFERDNYRCCECEARVIWESGYWESGHLAHIKSRGAGGKWILDNLRTLCMRCHMAEHNGGYRVVPRRPETPYRGV